MLVVNDESLWEKAQIVREKGTNRTRFVEGRDLFYTWHNLGSSYLLSDIDAAFLRASLDHFDEIQGKRLDVWKEYDQHLVVSSIFDKPKISSLANGHMYYLQLRTHELQQQFCSWMKQGNIVVATHYVPLEISPFIAKSNAIQGQPCPHSKKWYQTLVRLPLFFGFSQSEQERVCGRINSFALEHGFVLHKVLPEHYEAIRQIRNDNRDAFWQTEEISPEIHEKFMSRHKATYRVATFLNKVVGFVGHVDGDFRIACDSSQQGTGLASFLYYSFVREYPFVTVKVKKSNSRSMRFFEKLGLSPQASALADGVDPVPLYASSAE